MRDIFWDVIDVKRHSEDLLYTLNILITIIVIHFTVFLASQTTRFTNLSKFDCETLETLNYQMRYVLYTVGL